MRRRLLTGGVDINNILSQAQFWFDGRNNLNGGGYNTNSAYWYPYINNGASAIANNSYTSVEIARYGSWGEDCGIYENPVSDTQNLLICYIAPSGSFGDFTLSFCVNIESGTDFSFIRRNASVNVPGINVGVSSDSKLFLSFISYNGNNDVTYESAQFSDSVIHTVSFVHNNNTLSFYVNGKFISSTTTSTTTFTWVNSSYKYSLGRTSMSYEYYSYMYIPVALGKDENRVLSNFLKKRYFLEDPPQSFYITPNSAEIGAAAGTIAINVVDGSGNIIPNIIASDFTISGDNCTLDSYDSTTGILTIAYPANTGSSDINRTVSITYNGETATLNLTQKSLSTTLVSIYCNPDTFTVTCESGSVRTYLYGRYADNSTNRLRSIDANLLTVSGDGCTKGSVQTAAGSLYIHYPANSDPENTQTYVPTVTYDGMNTTVTINQSEYMDQLTFSEDSIQLDAAGNSNIDISVYLNGNEIFGEDFEMEILEGDSTAITYIHDRGNNIEIAIDPNEDTSDRYWRIRVYTDTAEGIIRIDQSGDVVVSTTRTATLSNNIAPSAFSNTDLVLQNDDSGSLVYQWSFTSIEFVTTNSWLSGKETVDTQTEDAGQTSLGSLRQSRNIGVHYNTYLYGGDITLVIDSITDSSSDFSISYSGPYEIDTYYDDMEKREYQCDISGGIVTYDGNEYELTNDIELEVEVSFDSSNNEVTVYGLTQSHIIQ